MSRTRTLHQQVLNAVLYASTLTVILLYAIITTPKDVAGQARWGGVILASAALLGFGLAITFATRWIVIARLDDSASDERKAARRLAVEAICAALFAGLLWMFAPALVHTIETEGAMQIRVGNGYIRIIGAIAPSLPRRLAELVDPDLPLTRLELENSGGSVEGAAAAADWLMSHGVRTAVVTGDCASACAFLALSFPRTLLAPDGRLGLHDVRALAGAQQSVQKTRLALIARLTSGGRLSTPVAERLLSTRDLSWPSRGELLDDGLVTGCWAPIRQLAVDCYEK